MANIKAQTVHRLSTSRCADAPHRNGGYWLGKRRDGRSDVWVVAWYEPNGRKVRYRSTRTRDLIEARQFLDKHAAANPQAETYRAVEYREPREVYFVGGDVGAIKIGPAQTPPPRLPQERNARYATGLDTLSGAICIGTGWECLPGFARDGLPAAPPLQRRRSR